jgi:hypothetical protein
MDIYYAACLRVLICINYKRASKQQSNSHYCVAYMYMSNILIAEMRFFVLKYRTCNISYTYIGGGGQHFTYNRLSEPHGLDTKRCYQHDGHSKLSRLLLTIVYWFLPDASGRAQCAADNVHGH